MTVASTDPLAAVPLASPQRLALRVTPAARRALREGHPWLFDRAITSGAAGGRPGDLAVIFDERRRFLAVGLYDPTSHLRVRVLHSGSPAAIDDAWLRRQLAAAAALRSGLQSSGTSGYRLVHGENDGLPGLVVDRYDAVLVVKLYTLAWVPHLASLRAALVDLCRPTAVVLRLARELVRWPQHLYGLGDGTLLAGSLPADGVAFRENGLAFEADVVRGQKTGFFFDQRENRARVERLAAGNRALNVFAYSGGFSLYAARGGAPEITSVDASAPALAAAERNFALNRDVPQVARARHTLVAADAFEELAALQRSGRRFDLVIVDPPAFAKREDEVERAVKTYRRLALLVLGVLAPGGTIVMASCSSRVSAPTFFDAVLGGAHAAGRPLRELERTGHALDHPVRFPEGAYLKCLFAVAE